MTRLVWIALSAAVLTLGGCSWLSANGPELVHAVESIDGPACEVVQLALPEAEAACLAEHDLVRLADTVLTAQERTSTAVASLRRGRSKVRIEVPPAEHKRVLYETRRAHARLTARVAP